MMRWLIRVGLVALSAVVGYWLMFLLRFAAVVLPHGGMW